MLQQTTRRGRRLSILGLYSIGVGFEYGLKLGSFNRDSSLKLMHRRVHPSLAKYQMASRPLRQRKRKVEGPD